MEAPFVDHKHGENFFFYRISYPIKIVNYSGRGVGTDEEELPGWDCAPCLLKMGGWFGRKERRGEPFAPPACRKTFFCSFTL
jgi:hypothetical protein